MACSIDFVIDNGIIRRSSGQSDSSLHQLSHIVTFLKKFVSKIKSILNEFSLKTHDISV